MPRPPHDIDLGRLHIVARRVLLDAAQALEAHHDAIVLIGAQAVYLQTRDADLTATLFTVDGDLGIDPRLLPADPRLEDALAGAGFTRQPGDRQEQPGQWYRFADVDGVARPIEVDLLVPESMASGGSRSTKIPPHSDHAARRAAGLEPAMVDYTVMQVASLEPDIDPRVVSLRVAGVAALLVAKAYKLQQRVNEPGQPRLVAKDAGDVYRLMIGSDVDQVAESFRALLTHEIAGSITEQGLDHLQALFGRARSPGVDLAHRALRLDRERMAAIITTYQRLLVDAIRTN